MARVHHVLPDHELERQEGARCGREFTVPRGLPLGTGNLFLSNVDTVVAFGRPGESIVVQEFRRSLFEMVGKVVDHDRL